MPDFSAVLADQNGVVLSDIRAPMTLAFQRNAAPKIDVQLDLEDSPAALIVDTLANGIPRLKMYRAGVLVANTVWTPMQETGGQDDGGLGQMAASFRGPFSLLESRFTDALIAYAGDDAGAIAWDLINTTNLLSAGTGIREGSIEATVNRDRTYEHKQIAEAIVQLCEVIGGFDFEVAPVDEDDICGAFNVYAQQGTDSTSTAVFEYGPGTIGNVRAVTRETRAPVNHARVLGADGLVSDEVDSASILKYGKYQVVEQAVDVSEQATLDAKASGLLRPNPIRVVEFTPDPFLAPQPWDDFWLGDVISFRANHGSLREDLTPRVNGITLQIDEEGNVASMTLTLDQDV